MSGMESGTSAGHGRRWFYAVAAALFLVSLSRGFEELTSPHILLSHVLLRKFYSVFAFSIVGYMRARLARASSFAGVAQTGGMVGLYSAGIEIVQRLLGSHEGLRWNLADTAMGVLGGLIGGSLYLLESNVRRAFARRAPQTRPATSPIIKDCDYSPNQN